ncbi:GIY-YIG nuclease family protein [Paenibacillus sp. GD4]|jgi:hypothetical protein|uniref:GIY-YIG nuclease family protein n=1 Tax=Paenibacillus TaxID=44249 RepID=UPI002543F763|nr:MULTISPECIES: GIY-YIG nuclease family protein [Paenibacillus]MDQ1914935.1 GIY-YIG nuclease family protein [Paenibacillus sp. GD4]
MDKNRKKELAAQFMEQKTIGGVYQIRNTANGKLFVDSTRNLRTLNGKMVSLTMGTHMSKSLQQDWNTYGKESFVFEILEEVEMKQDDFGKSADRLKKLEEQWLERLQPFGDKGYN